MWQNEASRTDTGSSLRPVMSSPTQNRSGRHPLESSPSWFRSALPAVLVATIVFGLGVVAGTAPSLLPKGLIPGASAPIELDGDSIPQAKQLTLLERAIEGNEKAIFELRQKKAEELTVDETLALDEVERRLVENSVRELGSILQTKRPEEIAPQAITDIIDFVGRKDTQRVALEQLAKIPNFLGPDLVYRASRTHRRDEDVVKLATALLSTDEVRNRASAAMSVVIDAMSAETCEEAREVLERAGDDGDRRSVQHLVRFAETTGCGPSKIDDCYRCLRGDRLLVDSVRLAQERIEPY